LPVEGVQLEGIEIGSDKAANSEAGQCQRIRAPDPAETGDRNAHRPQPLLFGFNKPADVAIERLAIIKNRRIQL